MGGGSRGKVIRVGHRCGECPAVGDRGPRPSPELTEVDEPHTEAGSTSQARLTLQLSPGPTHGSTFPLDRDGAERVPGFSQTS